MEIDAPVYIVLDVPSPMAETIRDFRRRFDPPRAGLPVEITLTGSCGTGLVSKGQELPFLEEKLAAAAKKIKPFRVSFQNVQRFPETDIYFLTLNPSEELLNAQRIVSDCGIRFDPTPYPYHPHCTLNLRRPISDEQELIDLFFLPVPMDPFQLEVLSMYAMRDANTCDILFKTELG